MKVRSSILFLITILCSFSAFPFSSSFTTRGKRISLILDMLERSIESQKQTAHRQFFSNNEESSESGVLQERISKYKDNFSLAVSGQLNRDGHKIALREYVEENVHISLGLQSGYIKGDSTYHISFSTGESELRFPLSTALLGLKFGLSMRDSVFLNRERMGLNVSWYRDIHHSGKMEDSDWINGDGHSGKDIYSESSTKINLDIVDVSYVWNFLFYKSISLGVAAGYKYHRYGYAVFDTDQVGYGPYAAGYTGYISGSTLVYSVKHRFLYFGVSSNLSLSKNFLLDIQGGYSPWARSKDRDDHILRYKLSEATCKGDAYFLQARGLWNIASDLYLDLSTQYTKIDTKGIQHQLFYAGPYAGLSADVNDKITSSYWLASASLNYLF